MKYISFHFSDMISYRDSNNRFQLGFNDVSMILNWENANMKVTFMSSSLNGFYLQYRNCCCNNLYKRAIQIHHIIAISSRQLYCLLSNYLQTYMMVSCSYKKFHERYTSCVFDICGHIVFVLRLMQKMLNFQDVSRDLLQICWMAFL